MLSPSKQRPHQQQQQQEQQQHHYHHHYYLLHHQQQQNGQATSRENKRSDSRTSYVRIRKGPRPLEKKSFYLDIKNHAIAAKLEAKIRELGGAIELFLVRSVTIVVSDRVDKAGCTNSERYTTWGCASGGSGGPRSLRSIEVPTPTPTPPTPLLSSECPSSNSNNLRGQTTQRSKSRVDAMLERALTQPQQCSVDPLDNAQSWGIPIWSTDKFHIWLEKIYASLRGRCNLNQLKQTDQRSSAKDLKVRHLKGPYVKFESFRRTTRPVFLELSAWPTLNFDGDPGTCPFDTKRQGKPESKLISKEVKENKKNIEFINKEEAKEMTRRPRATAARARKTEQLVTGYCEICRMRYDDLRKHLESEQHVKFVGDKHNFVALDGFINSSTNVEEFLKLNSKDIEKDIEKDCNLFPNGDSNLHDVVLPEEKVTKNTKTLSSSFSVDEIKMVQCNGARRNLNLKLSSPHNLRARTKHESGHLLRSKGSPWHEVDKSEKLYDKLEGFTIKKRSKGTIWIEEEDPDDKYAEEILKESKQEDYKIKSFSKDIDGVYRANNKDDNISNKHSNLEPSNVQQSITVHNSAQNGIISSRRVSEDSDYLRCKDRDERNGDENAGPLECTINENGVVGNSYIAVVSCKQCKDESYHRENCAYYRSTCALQAEKMTVDARKFSDDAARIDATDVICNVHNGGKGVQKELNASSQIENTGTRHEKPRHHPRGSRRGGRNMRGRHRLSVEERLIEDNRAYYKVEVLGNKLRSSALPGSGNSQHAISKDGDGEVKKEEEEETPSSEKPVVVRFKRVRKSELSLLSDEAESFMFGELKRDDSSEASDGEQSSVLPKDTESEANESANSTVLSSSPLISGTPVKQEVVEEDSQDSVHLGRARKRRRTQAEAFIKDNTDYYKFETPGSRLRYQAPITGIKDATDGGERGKKLSVDPGDGGRSSQTSCDVVEKIYPSKPSAEIEKMQFSFEAIPKSEPWYQTYQRQDAGAEFWHCFSENDTMKPFLLPYEIENFHETLMRHPSGRVEGKRRGRGRGAGYVGRSPRKSPRCHASTLAIMSTIIRKREQQQSSSSTSTTTTMTTTTTTTPLYTIEESSPVVHASRTNTLRPPERKQDFKSEIDEELKEMARTIDEMLSAKGTIELDDSFEPDEQMRIADVCGSSIPKGAPSNLLELLDNCHDITNCLENSSCASSECGEGNVEYPLKRRKRRKKNRTGWPGNKMKKKLQSNSVVSKSLVDACERKRPLTEKRLYPDVVRLGNLTGTTRCATALSALNGLPEESETRTVTTSTAPPSAAERLGANSKSDADTLLPDNSAVSAASHKSCHEGPVKREKSAETPTNDTGLPASVGSYAADSSVSENATVNDSATDRKPYLPGKECPFGKELSEMEEISENDPGNDENNHLSFRKDVANALPITERNFVAKSPIRKRGQREHHVATAAAVTAAAAELACAESRTEIENQDNLLCRKDAEAGIVPRKYHNNELSSKRQQQRRGNSENAAEGATELPLLGQRHRDGVLYRRRRVGSRKRIYSRKRQSRPSHAAANLSPSDVTSRTTLYEDENCKKDTCLSITCKKQHQQQQQLVRASMKRKSEAISSESVQETDVECPLSERMTPSALSTMSELEQRRSSIDFQPVVRMMKIDDQVEMDHNSSILSVAVASNRRLRSSGMPRSNAAKPARKRLKSSGRGQFGRWLKNS